MIFLEKTVINLTKSNLSFERVEQDHPFIGMSQIENCASALFKHITIEAFGFQKRDATLHGLSFGGQFGFARTGGGDFLAKLHPGA